MKQKLIKFKVYVQTRTRKFPTPTKSQFQQWAESALMTPSKASEVTIRIVTPSESETLNKTYRHKNGPTNVLSFSYRGLPGENSSLLGDLVICAELVQKEAQAEKKNLIAHWAHLTVHGMLHLQGYDHVNSKEAEQMEQLEIKILNQLHFENPYE